MPLQKVQGLLKIASEQVPQGIYAIQKGAYYELRNETMTTTQIKKAKREYRAQGMRVFANGA